MPNVELIVAALSAGATAGLTDTASVAVKDAYAGLKNGLRPWVRGRARQALAADEIAPELAEELTASGADTDEEIMVLAERLLSLVDRKAAAKYRVDLAQAKGVQVGDHNVQTNHF